MHAALGLGFGNFGFDGLKGSGFGNFGFRVSGILGFGNFAFNYNSRNTGGRVPGKKAIGILGLRIEGFRDHKSCNKR